MPDGRKKHHARAAAVIATALTTVGLGIASASPAAATPTTDIDTAKSRAERLGGEAAQASKRHDRARTSLQRTRARTARLAEQIQQQRRIMDDLRSAVARAAVSQYDGPSGASVPPRPLSEDSRVLLANVTLVSEDTAGRGQALADANARVADLAERRMKLRGDIPALRDREKRLSRAERTVGQRAARADAVVADLERRAAEKAEAERAEAEAERAEAAAQRAEAMGGPVVAYAMAQIGKSYVWGAAGPSSFDCSGLTMMAWKQAGVSLPHSSGAQYSAGQRISESELRPGDLVFYYTPISHVGIYVGNGQVANALNPGSGVRISGLHDMPYVGAVRPG